MMFILYVNWKIGPGPVDNYVKNFISSWIQIINHSLTAGHTKSQVPIKGSLKKLKVKNTNSSFRGMSTFLEHGHKMMKS